MVQSFAVPNQIAQHTKEMLTLSGERPFPPDALGKYVPNCLRLLSGKVIEPRWEAVQFVDGVSSRTIGVILAQSGKIQVPIEERGLDASVPDNDPTIYLRRIGLLVRERR